MPPDFDPDEWPERPDWLNVDGTVNAALFPDHMPVADENGPLLMPDGTPLCVRVNPTPPLPPLPPVTSVNGPDPVGSDVEETETVLPPPQVLVPCP